MSTESSSREHSRKQFVTRLLSHIYEKTQEIRILKYCLKKETDVAHYKFQRTSTDFGNFWQRCCCYRAAICFSSTPNVSALPGETHKRENRAFQKLCLCVARIQPVAAWFLPYCWLATHFHDAVWLHKSCTVISWVHLWAAGPQLWKKWSFALQQLNCAAHTMRCEWCCWKKNSIHGVW